MLNILGISTALAVGLTLIGLVVGWAFYPTTITRYYIKQKPSRHCVYAAEIIGRDFAVICSEDSAFIGPIYEHLRQEFTGKPVATQQQ